MSARAFVWTLAVLFMGSGASAEDRPLRAALYDTAWIAGAGTLDLVSTHYALERCPRCYESNPFMQSTGKALMTKAVTTAAAGYVCYELRKKGHPRAAKVFRWVAVGVWSGLAINNMAHAR